jgi:hypothetical protein
MSSQRGRYKPKSEKPFNPDEPIVMSQFAKIVGHNKSSIMRLVDRGKLIADENKKIIPSVFQNAMYVQRSLICADRILHTDKEQQQRDKESLFAIRTRTPLPAPAEVYNYENMRMSTEDKFFIYELGFSDEDTGEFYPIAEYSKHPKGEYELTILPTDHAVTFIMQKGVIQNVNIDYEACSDELYMRLKS